MVSYYTSLVQKRCFTNQVQFSEPLNPKQKRQQETETAKLQTPLMDTQTSPVAFTETVNLNNDSYFH